MRQFERNLRLTRSIVSRPKCCRAPIHQIRRNRSPARAGRRGFRVRRQIACERRPPVFPEFREGRQVFLRKQPIPIRRHVQQQIRAAPRRVIVQPDERRAGFTSAFSDSCQNQPGRIETSHSAGSQCDPCRVPRGRFVLAHVAGRGGPAIRRHGIVRRPARVARDAALVAHPAHVRAHVAEDHRVRLQLADQIPGLRPIVVGALVDGAFLARAAVVAVAAVGAIVPDLEDRAVIRQQFGKLRAVDVDVCRACRRPRCCGPTAKDKRRTSDLRRLAASARSRARRRPCRRARGSLRTRVLGGLGGPQTEAIVMLAGEDHAAHARRGQRA